MNDVVIGSIHVVAQIRAVVVLGRVSQIVVLRVRDQTVTIAMARMEVSVAWTESWPRKPLVTQPGLSGISRRFRRRQRPDVELLELFMKSAIAKFKINECRKCRLIGNNK